MSDISNSSLTQQELDKVALYEETLDQEFERAYLNIPSDDQITIEEET